MEADESSDSYREELWLESKVRGIAAPSGWGAALHFSSLPALVLMDILG